MKKRLVLTEPISLAHPVELLLRPSTSARQVGQQRRGARALDGANALSEDIEVRNAAMRRRDSVQKGVHRR